MAKMPWTDFQDMDKSKPKLIRLNFNLLMKEFTRLWHRKEDSKKE
jgi:hypothetical protein